MINGDMTMVNSTSSCQRRNVESLLCRIKKLIVLSYGFVYSPTSWLTISQTNIRGEYHTYLHPSLQSMSPKFKQDIIRSDEILKHFIFSTCGFRFHLITTLESYLKPIIPLWTLLYIFNKKTHPALNFCEIATKMT